MAKQKTLISIFNYGGGMRGLIPAHIMAYIEKRTGLHMADMVDVFTGPSTGSILNAGLNIPHPRDPTRPKFKAKYMVRFYEQEGVKIFPPDNSRDIRGLIHDLNNRTVKIEQLGKLFDHGHYDPSHLGYCLRRLYGDTTLCQTLKSIVIPTFNIDGERLRSSLENASLMELNNFMDEGGHAVWFKNIKFSDKDSPCPKVPLYDAVMASTAAPTFFPCHQFDAHYPKTGETVHYSGIDGSLFDNPCINYHGALRQHIPDDTQLITILLGTGYTVRSISGEDWNSYGGLGVVDPVHDLPLIRLLFHAPESALVESFSERMGDNLFVFNKSMIDQGDNPHLPNHSIDDASPDNLKNMKHFAYSIIEENQDKLDQLCNILVKNYEQNQKPNPKNILNKLFS